MSDDLVSTEEINAFRQDAARFRFLAVGLQVEWTVMHKPVPEEQYIITISWRGHEKFASLAEMVDELMKQEATNG